MADILESLTDKKKLEELLQGLDGGKVLKINEEEMAEFLKNRVHSQVPCYRRSLPPDSTAMGEATAQTTGLQRAVLGPTGTGKTELGQGTGGISVPE